MAVDWWVGNSRGRVNLGSASGYFTGQKNYHHRKVRSLCSARIENESARDRGCSRSSVRFHHRRHMKANPPSVQGAPLILEFDKTIGRPAVGQEHDVVFDSAALLK